MKCYVCLMEDGLVKEIVGLCRFCGVGVCAIHFTDAASTTQGGMHYGCRHPLPTAAQVARAKSALGATGFPYVAACRHCGIALTPAALAEPADQSQGGMRYSCNHTRQLR